jgi:hypothetical protein
MRHPLSDISKNSALPDDDSSARIERLLRGANDAAALRHRLALIDIEGAHRLAAYHSHFNPNQPRVPKGHHDGGQWTRAGGAATRESCRTQRMTTTGSRARSTCKPGAAVPVHANLADPDKRRAWR